MGSTDCQMLSQNLAYLIGMKRIYFVVQDLVATLNTKHFYISAEISSQRIQIWSSPILVVLLHDWRGRSKFKCLVTISMLLSPFWIYNSWFLRNPPFAEIFILFFLSSGVSTSPERARGPIPRRHMPREPISIHRQRRANPLTTTSTPSTPLIWTACRIRAQKAGLEVILVFCEFLGNKKI
jgi:hypothetical protein